MRSSLINKTPSFKRVGLTVLYVGCGIWSVGILIYFGILSNQYNKTASHKEARKDFSCVEQQVKDYYSAFSILPRSTEALINSNNLHCFESRMERAWDTPLTMFIGYKYYYSFTIKDANNKVVDSYGGGYRYDNDKTAGEPKKFIAKYISIDQLGECDNCSDQNIGFTFQP